MPARLAAVAVVAVGALLAACGDDRDAPSVRDISATALASAVDVRATGCRTEAVRGAGAVIAGGYVLTAAHVVAGADTITVRAASGTEAVEAVEAKIIAFDPTNDLALVSPAGLPLPELPLGGGETGESGVTVIFRDDEAVVTPLTVAKPVIVHILDIFHEHEIDRPGYVVTVDIDPGDSGAVVVGADGSALGVLYATSRATSDRSFATNVSAIDALVRAAGEGGGERPTDSLRCIP